MTYDSNVNNTMTDPLVLRQQDAVAELELNRPQRSNSLVPEMLEAMADALAQVEARAQTRVLILSARGQAFSTGGDLGAFLEHWQEIENYSRRIVGGLNRVVLALARLRVPVIAAAQGWTTGGSIGLLLGADMVLLADNARLAPYYTEVGFSPDGGWGRLLPDLIGARRAAELQYLNRPLLADEAVALGLANRVVPLAGLQEEARRWAARIASMSPASVASTKRLLRADTAHWPQRLEEELEAFVACIQTAGARERAQAFVAGLKR